MQQQQQLFKEDRRHTGNRQQSDGRLIDMSEGQRRVCTQPGKVHVVKEIYVDYISPQSN